MAEKIKAGNIKNAISFTGALFIALSILKLTDIINWSWWLITAMYWIPLTAFVSVQLVTWLILWILKKLNQII